MHAGRPTEIRNQFLAHVLTCVRGPWYRDGDGLDAPWRWKKSNLTNHIDAHFPEDSRWKSWNSSCTWSMIPMFTWSCWKYKWKFPMHWEWEWTWWQLLTYVLPWRVCVHIPTSWPSPIVWHCTKSNLTSLHASSSCVSLGESRGRAPLQWSTPPHPNPPGWPGCKYLCHQVLNANWFKLSNTWNRK